MTDQTPENTQLFLTAPMPCPYLPGKQERKLFTHLTGRRASSLHALLSDNGFRSSQNLIYRPACEGCAACQSVRILAREFETTKRYRRILNLFADNEVGARPPRATAEQFGLFKRYLEARHTGGGMTAMNFVDYEYMVENTPVQTVLVEYRLGGDPEKPLVAVALTDVMPDGLSMVYSFFTPDLQARGLGTLLILATAIPAILALLGFAVPVFDLLNHLQLLLIIGTLAGFVLALLFRMGREWIAFALLGVITSGITFVPELASSFATRPSPPPNVQVLKVMTHNIFGLNYDMQRVANVIAAEDPDIVAIQEYFPEQSALDKLLRPTYPYAARCQGGKRANLGLYSKIPFDREMSAADCPSGAYGTQRTAHIIAGFTLADGTHFSVMTTHMDWPFPIERQRTELATAAQEASNVDGPLLVVGDINSTPWSYAMQRFEAATDLRRETRNLLTFPELFRGPPRISKDEIVHT